MPCADVNGRFPTGKVTSDSGTVSKESPLTFSFATGGQIVVEYDGDGKSFPVTCTNIGKLATITYTRVQSNGTTTEYTGLVAPIPAKKILRISGRYERTSSSFAPESGDWETEKAT